MDSTKRTGRKGIPEKLMAYHATSFFWLTFCFLFLDIIMERPIASSLHSGDSYDVPFIPSSGIFLVCNKTGRHCTNIVRHHQFSDTKPQNQWRDCWWCSDACESVTPTCYIASHWHFFLFFRTRHKEIMCMLVQYKTEECLLIEDNLAWKLGPYSPSPSAHIIMFGWPL